MKQEPWILAGGVLFGVAAGTVPFAIFFPSLIFWGAGICFILLRTFPRINQAALLGGFILFLATFWYGQARMEHFNTLESQRVENTEYRVSGIPEEKTFYQAITLVPLNDASWWERKDAVLWQAPLAVTAAPGERLTLTCDLALPENFTPDFNYRLYLAKEGVGYLCEEAESFALQGSDKLTKIYELLYAPRKNLERGIERSIPEPEAGLAKGLLLGGSAHLSSMIQDEFTNLGLTHIVAVSGYNIVIIVNGILFVGLGLGLWRKQATILAFFGTAFFIFMIGAPASAVRAGIMATAAFGAFLIGRIHYSLLAVWFTAALMVLWNPLSLWYDAGFQLSFLATIAVILAMRSVEGKLAPPGLVRSLQEIVWLAVWVYLFLLPILLLQFHTFTVLSIPANILFLPFVPIAMLGSFAVTLTTLLIPPAAVIVGWIAYLPLTYILRGTHFLSQIPGMTVPVHLPLFFVVGWYILLFFVIVHREEIRRHRQYAKNFQCPHNH